MCKVNTVCGSKNHQYINGCTLSHSVTLTKHKQDKPRAEDTDQPRAASRALKRGWPRGQLLQAANRQWVYFHASYYTYQWLTKRTSESLYINPYGHPPRKWKRTSVPRPWGLYIRADPSLDTGVHRSKCVNPHLGCIPPPQSDTNILEWSNIVKHNNTSHVAFIFLFSVKNAFYEILLGVRAGTARAG